MNSNRPNKTCGLNYVPWIILFAKGMTFSLFIAFAQQTQPELSQKDQDLMQAAMLGPTKETISLVFNEKTGGMDEEKVPAFTKTVTSLLDAEANINARYPDGTTPLMVAIRYNNIPSMHTLIERETTPGVGHGHKITRGVATASRYYTLGAGATVR